MSRSLEDILFGDPRPQARVARRAASAVTAAVLLLLAAGVVLRFHAAGQLGARYWEFFALPTTWAFLAKGLLGTVASAAQAAPIALSVGLVVLRGRLARPRLLRWPSVAVIGVSTTPKQIELLRMLCLLHSRAAVIVMPSMPALAAA